MVAKLTELIRALVDGAEQNRDISALLHELHKHSGEQRFTAADLRMLYGASSPEELAEELALGQPVASDELSRDEILELLRLAEEPGPKQTFYLNALERHFPACDVSDLIFWPDRERTTEEMTDGILLRQKLLAVGGVEAIKAYLTRRAEEVLADPNATPWALTWAEGYLAEPIAIDAPAACDEV